MTPVEFRQGESARIGLNVTAFKEGSISFTPDNSGLYIDTKAGGVETRLRVNQREVISSQQPEILTAGDTWLQEVE